MEAERNQIEFSDENIDNTSQIIFRYPVIQALWKKCGLIPLTPSMKPAMQSLPTLRKDSTYWGFYTGSAGSGLTAVRHSGRGEVEKADTQAARGEVGAHWS